MTPRSGRPLLYVAEDDPGIQRVLQIVLDREQFDVVFVSDGETLLSQVAGRAPDGILLDWMLPGMEGPDICRRLKADSSTAAIPVVFLTARSQTRDVDQGLALGAAGYIIKPFDALTIGRDIRLLLAKASA